MTTRHGSQKSIMKKINLVFSVFILMLLLSNVAFAETSPTSTRKIEDLKEKMLELKERAGEKRAEVKERADEKRIEAKAKLASTTERMKERKSELKDKIEIKIGKKLDERKLKIAKEFEKSLLILKNLLARTESRIMKMESENINASSSRALLEVAKSKLSLAETELTNFENALAVEIPASTSTDATRKSERKALLKNLNSQAKEVKSSIKVAHKSIVEVIASLKRGLMKKDRSTSTPEIVSTSTNN